MKKTETIDAKVKSKKIYSLPCIGEDTPDVEICELDIEPLTSSSFQKMMYHFFWKGWIEKVEDVEDYDDYERFKNFEIGDVLRVVYFPMGRYVNPEIPWERIDSTILSIMKGNYVTSGGSYACHPAKSTSVKSIENLTQNWKIE